MTRCPDRSYVPGSRHTERRSRNIQNADYRSCASPHTGGPVRAASGVRCPWACRHESGSQYGSQHQQRPGKAQRRQATVVPGQRHVGRRWASPGLVRFPPAPAAQSWGHRPDVLRSLGGRPGPVDVRSRPVPCLDRHPARADCQDWSRALASRAPPDVQPISFRVPDLIKIRICRAQRWSASPCRSPRERPVMASGRADSPHRPEWGTMIEMASLVLFAAAPEAAAADLREYVDIELHPRAQDR